MSTRSRVRVSWLLVLIVVVAPLLLGAGPASSPIPVPTLAPDEQTYDDLPSFLVGGETTTGTAGSLSMSSQEAVEAFEEGLFTRTDPPSEGMSPQEVVEAFEDAMNRGDLEAATALIADNAVWECPRWPGLVRTAIAGEPDGETEAAVMQLIAAHLAMDPQTDDILVRMGVTRSDAARLSAGYSRRPAAGYVAYYPSGERLADAAGLSIPERLGMSEADILALAESIGYVTQYPSGWEQPDFSSALGEVVPVAMSATAPDIAAHLDWAAIDEDLLVTGDLRSVAARATASLYTGKDEVCAWLAYLVREHAQVLQEVIAVDAGLVQARAAVSWDAGRTLGVAPVTGTEVFTVADGKITGFHWTTTSG